MGTHSSPTPPTAEHPTPGSWLPLKVVVDMILVFAGIWAAYTLRFEGLPPEPYLAQATILAPVLALVRMVANRSFGVYRLGWRSFGLRESLTFALPMSLVSVAMLLMRGTAGWLSDSVATGAATGAVVTGAVATGPVANSVAVIPLGVIALEGLGAMGVLIAVRIGARLWDEYRSRAELQRTGVTLKRALLVGAGHEGRLAARELINRPDAGYEVVGFVDDDKRRLRQVIEGITVLGTTANLGHLVREHDIEVLILTMPSARAEQQRAVATRCRQQVDLPVHTVPGLFELLSQKVEITKIRPVSVGNLLGRDVIEFCPENWPAVRALFADTCVVVTGAGGSIGSELCRQLAQLEPSRLLLLDNHENNLFDIHNEMRALLGDAAVPCLVDIRDRGALEKLFEHERPQVVFHAAAYKHVPMMELHPTAAVDNNIRGTRIVSQVAQACGVAHFLCVSTDKAVHPTSVMGASKRMAELVVQAQADKGGTKFCTVRFGNVLGSRGSVLHTFQRQIEAGGPVTLTHPDVTRFFMTIPEAVRLVIQAIAVSEGGELFLLDMGKPIRIYDLARRMIELSGLSVEDIEIEIVGLRPGEKLHEELWRADEGGRKSGVEGVTVASPQPRDADEVWAVVKQIEQAADAGDIETLVRALEHATHGELRSATASVCRAC